MSIKGASQRSLIDAILGGKIDDIMYEIREKLAGVDLNGKFQPHWLVETYTPLIVGLLVSKYVGGWPLNINQKMKDIPFIKIQEEWKIVTRSHAFAATAATADTKTTMGSAYSLPIGGTIKRIRLAFYQGVIDKSCSGILTVETNIQKGPFEFAVGGQMGITTTSGATGPNCQTEEIEVSIPVKINEEITVSLTMTEALEECVVSIMWEQSRLFTIPFFKDALLKDYHVKGASNFSTSTTSHKFIVPNGKVWLLVVGRTVRSDSATLTVKAYRKDTTMIAQLVNDSATTGGTCVPEDAQTSSIPPLWLGLWLKSGDYIRWAFGAAQGATAECLVRVWEWDMNK